MPVVAICECVTVGLVIKNVHLPLTGSFSYSDPMWIKCGLLQFIKFKSWDEFNYFWAFYKYVCQKEFLHCSVGEEEFSINGQLSDFICYNVEGEFVIVIISDGLYFGF